MTSATRWTVIMPVKALSAAKSRLGRAGAGDLAFAFFEDALAAVGAATSVDEVLVATGDPRVAQAATRGRGRVIDDTGRPGINAAARWAASQRALEGGVAVMVADLPCLTPDAVDTALALAAQHPTSFVADADGTGTTMWLCTAGQPVRPAFGVGSRAAHLAAGDVDLAAVHADRAAALLPARCDVDTDDDLARARALGLGSASARLLDA